MKIIMTILYEPVENYVRLRKYMAFHERYFLKSPSLPAEMFGLSEGRSRVGP
jgi:hypothetical protein